MGLQDHATDLLKIENQVSLQLIVKNWFMLQCNPAYSWKCDALLINDRLSRTFYSIHWHG